MCPLSLAVKMLQISLSGNLFLTLLDPCCDFVEFGPYSLSSRSYLRDHFPVSRLSYIEGKPKKVKSPLLHAPRRLPFVKGDQLRFLFIQLKFKLLEPFSQGPLYPLRISVIFAADHRIVRIPE